MGKKNVSLRVIAAELGVSVNTVSHALRDMDDISKEMKQKVRQKALELGYMPNQVSQNSKYGEKAVVAILIASFRNLYFTFLADHLTKLFENRKEYNVLFLYKSKNKDVEIIKQCVLQRVDLLIVHKGLDKEAMEFAKINNIQIVIVAENQGNYAVDNVTVDEQSGCIQAARYLHGFYESKRFLYVGIDYPLSDYRFDIFRKELNSMGSRDVVRVMYENGKPENIYSYIEKGYRNLFFYNDEVAYNALNDLDKILVDTRKLYPDLHVVGFDGLCEENLGMKQITTIKIDYLRFAEAIYDMVKYRLENPKKPCQRGVVPVSIHRRRKKE